MVEERQQLELSSFIMYSLRLARAPTSSADGALDGCGRMDGRGRYSRHNSEYSRSVPCRARQIMNGQFMGAEGTRRKLNLVISVSYRDRDPYESWIAKASEPPNAIQLGAIELPLHLILSDK